MNNHATFHEILYVIPVIFYIKDKIKQKLRVQTHYVSML